MSGDDSEEMFSFAGEEIVRLTGLAVGELLLPDGSHFPSIEVNYVPAEQQDNEGAKTLRLLLQDISTLEQIHLLLGEALPR